MSKIECDFFLGGGELGFGAKPAISSTRPIIQIALKINK